MFERLVFKVVFKKNLKLNGIFLENMNIKDEMVIKIIFNKRFKFYS